MPFLLDTSTCSAHFKEKEQGSIFSRLIQHSGQLCVSRITCAELYALGYRRGQKGVEEVDDFLQHMQILEFDEECATTYGRIHSQLAAMGMGAQKADLMIAATAVAHGLVLVTRDRDFDLISRVVVELRLVDWL